ncbi:MAG: MarR family winged helix-turn-helix transcriptional regulator [Acidimicrobiales bacterium]
MEWFQIGTIPVCYLDVDSQELSVSERYPRASSFVEAIGAVIRVLRPHMDQLSELQSFKQLSPRQRMVIMHLAMKQSLSVSELARLLNASLAATSQAVTQLSEQGFVARHEDPADHRRTLVQLAGRTASVSRRIVDGRLGPLEAAFEMLDGREITVMLNALGKVAGALETLTQFPPHDHLNSYNPAAEADSTTTTKE